jgi:hypothetical protein
VTLINAYDPFGGDIYREDLRDETGHFSDAGIFLWTTLVAGWVFAGSPV